MRPLEARREPAGGRRAAAAAAAPGRIWIRGGGSAGRRGAPLPRCRCRRRGRGRSRGGVGRRAALRRAPAPAAVAAAVTGGLHGGEIGDQPGGGALRRGADARGGAGPPAPRRRPRCRAAGADGGRRRAAAARRSAGAPARPQPPAPRAPAAAGGRGRLGRGRSRRGGRRSRIACAQPRLERLHALTGVGQLVAQRRRLPRLGEEQQHEDGQPHDRGEAGVGAHRADEVVDREGVGEGGPWRKAGESTSGSGRQVRPSRRPGLRPAARRARPARRRRPPARAG